MHQSVDSLGFLEFMEKEIAFILKSKILKMKVKWFFGLLDDFQTLFVGLKSIRSTHLLTFVTKNKLNYKDASLIEFSNCFGFFPFPFRPVWKVFCFQVKLIHL